DFQAGGRAWGRADGLARHLWSATHAGGRARDPGNCDRRDRQAARDAGEIPRHRLRADRLGRRGGLRPPYRRGEALDGIPDGYRVEEVIPKISLSIRPIHAIQELPGKLSSAVGSPVNGGPAWP